MDDVVLIDAVSDEDEDEEVLIRREKGLEGIFVLLRLIDEWRMVCGLLFVDCRGEVWFSMMTAVYILPE